MPIKFFNNNLLFISYFTYGTVYEQFANSLMYQLESLKLSYDIIGIDDKGSWVKNEQYKPWFILEKIKQYPNRKLVFIDIDSTIFKLPDFFFKINSDLGIRFDTNNNEKVFTSTIFLESNQRTKRFFEDWTNLTKIDGSIKYLSRNTFYFALKTFIKKEQLKIINIPPEYCYDLYEMKKSFPNLSPIILNKKTSKKQPNFYIVDKEESNNLILFIPAREGSKGVPHKNRKLFDFTVNEIPKELQSKLVVSTDDDIVLKKCIEKNLDFYKRSEILSNDTASMKDVLLDFITKYKIHEDTNIVLLYLTYPERKWQDIINAFDFFNFNKAKSLLCKKDIKTNPYLCMYEKENKGEQVIQHNLYRRQDYKHIFEISHFIGIFKAGEIKNLNNNLYNKETIFFKIEDVIDVDTFQDLKKIENLSFKDHKEYDFSNILVNLDSEELKTYFKNKSICLVANSSALLDYEYGEFIDSHDIVIRFNNYKINKKYTGEKISIHVIFRDLKINSDEKIDYKIIISAPIAEWKKRIIEELQINRKYSIINFNYPTSQELKKFNCKNVLVPTSGLCTFILMMKMGLSNQLTLIGFNGYEGGKIEKVYRNTDKIFLSSAHSYKDEQFFWEKNFKKINEISSKPIL